MSGSNNLFEEFPSISKEEWLEKVKKDLKGRALEELQWQLNETLNIAPFYHGDDQIPDSKINHGLNTDNIWDIGEDCWVEVPAASNKEILAALENGVNAPCFIFKEAPSTDALDQLFEAIIPSYIQTHFKISGDKKDYTTLLKNYHKLLVTRKIKTTDLQGSIYYSPQKGDDFEVLKTCSELFPSFKSINLDFRSKDVQASNVVDFLKNLVLDLDKLFQQLTPTQVKLIQVTIPVGKSYFVEIAKIRASRILWANLLQAYGCSQDIPLVIDAVISSETYDENTHTNMIRSMTTAMSAVVGGVDRLTVTPADSKRTTLSVRIARNVQHLLKMESYMDRVIDPAAGSFYIEKLTRLFAQKAWDGLS